MNPPKLSVSGRLARSGFILGPLDLSFGSGITCVLGENGSGKSTLFRAIAGFERLRDGRVHMERGVSIGYMPQEPIFPGFATCRQYLAHAAWIHGSDRRPESVEEMLLSVGMSDQGGKAIRELSGGMRRRLAYAASVIHKPDVVLLDEPTVGLDPVQRSTIREVIKSTVGEGTMLLATHLADDVETLADHVLVLSRGRVVFHGSRHEMKLELTKRNLSDLRFEDALIRLMDSGD